MPDAPAIAAIGMYYFEREAQPEAFASIPAAMWWAFATLTIVGYGDVTPVTAGGKVFGRSESAWEDGVLTDDERVQLERFRVALGLGRHTASTILDAEAVRATLKGGGCPHLRWRQITVTAGTADAAPAVVSCCL